jgi:hypothetical protein
MKKEPKAPIGGLFALFFLVAIALVIVRDYDLPWSVDQLSGTVIGWGSAALPSQNLLHYRSILAVQTDDARMITVQTHRYLAPPIDERINIQKRVGWFGTVKYVEIPAR